MASLALLILASEVIVASSASAAQASFNVQGGARTEDPQETHRVVTKAIGDIETVASAAGNGKEAVEEVFIKSHNAISRLGARGMKALPEIHGVLTDSARDWKVKAMMCEALGKINSPESADELSKVLTDPKQHEFVRAVAGDKLALLGRPEAEPLVKQTVSDKSVPIQVRARTMMSVGVAGFGDVDWLKQAAVGDGIGLPSNKHEDISQDEAGLMMNAQRALGKSKNPRALGIILELQEQFPTNGIYTDILEEKLDPKSVPVLLKILAYKNPKGFTSDSMIVAARTLGKMRAREAADPLVEIIATDKNPLFVLAAAKALMNIDTARARPIIRKLVANLENDERFSRGRHPNFWANEQAGWGPIVELKKLVK